MATAIEQTTTIIVRRFMPYIIPKNARIDFVEKIYIFTIDVYPHNLIQSNQTKTKGVTKMAKEEDRHTGTRENIWFPYNEHAAMLAAMDALKETNKSNFIRSAVRNFANEIMKKGGK